MVVKTAILEATGHSSDPAAFARIQEFLNHEDERLVRAAIRALASTGHADAVGIIAVIMEDQQRPISVRTEAAMRLSSINDPQVMEILARNLASSNNLELSTAIVSVLGERPLAESEPLLAALLSSKDSPRELRVAALESLGLATENPGRLVIGCIGDADAEIRLAAAWALGVTTARINYGRELTDALAIEPNAEVRAALYSAMANQQPPPAEAMKTGIQQERNDAPRAAGLWALARAMQREGVPDGIRSWFDSVGVETLRALAASDEGGDVRKTALMALQLVENGAARPAP
jgi:HEAT repeat protein